MKLSSLRVAIVTLVSLAFPFSPRHVFAETGLPDIYSETPLSLVSAETISSFPINTFLENLVVSPTGDLWVNNHEVGEIIQVAPDGTQTLCVKVEGKVTGIALVSQHEVIINGWDPEGIPFVALVEGLCADATVTFTQTVPDAVFLNGITPLSATQYLMADSYRGAIWLFDTESRSASLWLEHPLLARSDAESPFPAANGLKRFDDTLYVSNTQQMLLLRIPLTGADQLSPGEPEIFLEGTNIDDFAFDMEGNLYAATHVYNSIIRITPDGQTSIIANVDQELAGSTAVAFGQAENDRSTLYVVTNGGMFLPPPTGVEPGRVIQLESEQRDPLYCLNQ